MDHAERTTRRTRQALSVALSVAAALWPRAAAGQTPAELVPILTEQTAPALSNLIGTPATAIVNEAGDYAFLGARGTAIFYRPAAGTQVYRAVQVGDPVPGVAEGRVGQLFGPLHMNGAGVVAFRATVHRAQGPTSAFMTFDGTTVRTVASGLDSAPGGGAFGPTGAVHDINDAGDLLVSATPAPGSDLRLFVIASGGAGVAVAGPGDPAPGAGTFTSVAGYALTNSRDALFTAGLSTGGSGVFVWSNGPIRKVVATGDPNPSPVGGTFSDSFLVTSTATPSRWIINNAGEVAFAAANSIYVNTAGQGTTPVFWPGQNPPGCLSLSVPGTNVYVSNDTGDLIFGGGCGAGFALFRFRQGALSIVAQAITPAPGTNQNFNGIFLTVTVNAAGTVSFQGNSGGAVSLPLGLYQRALGGPLVDLWLHGAATPAGGEIVFINALTQTLADGRVFVRGNIANAEATHGHFLVSAGSIAPIVTNADPLPPGGRVVIRPPFLTAASPYVGFEALRAGGRPSLGVVWPGQVVSVVATDGDVVAGTGGARVAIGTSSSVLVNGAGSVVFQGTLLGGAPGAARAAILVAGLLHPLRSVVANGDTDTAGRVLTSPSFGVLGTRPVSVNTLGQVAFTAIVDGGARGMFVGAQGTPAVKVALVGDAVPGGPITAIGATPGGINDLGQVLFFASTAVNSGLFVGGGGSGATPIAQTGDPAPGGGTFSGFGATPVPGFNNAGQVAFLASVSGGSGGGLFVGTAGNLPELVVAHGEASPAGGTFVLTTPRPDVTIADGGALAFLADLAGASGPMGIFVRAGGQPVQTVAIDGQAAPGGAGTLTLGRLNGLMGQPHQVSAGGHVAFRATSGGEAGWWHREPGGAIQRITQVGSADAVFDGGTVQDVASISTWMTNGWLPMWMPLEGGAHSGGLYLWMPVVGAFTGAGSNVAVAPPAFPAPSAPVTLTFGSVTGPGLTRVTRSAAGPAVPRAAYRLSGLAPYYQITTTAIFTGAVEVCIDVSAEPLAAGAVLRLLHHDGSGWVDVTTHFAAAHVICGSVTSFSSFVVAHALNLPSADWIQNGGFGAGAAGWSTFDGTMVSAVVNGVFEYSRPGGTAVVLQSTGMAVAAGDPLVATFEMGNSSAQRKRFSVLIHNDFAFPADTDLSVCTFWLPPMSPLRAYAMRTHATIAWQSATISIYAASGATDAGAYRLDNVVLGPGHALSAARTDCVDPLEPGAPGGPDSGPLAGNGGFTGGDAPILDVPHPNGPWVATGTITAQVANGVAQFVRPSGAAPSGVLLQPTGTALAAGEIVSATFRLGNSSAVRKRVTVLLHDFTFTDLAACTFWLAPGQPLSPYSMRTYATGPWTSATISFYPATTDQLGWFELDDVSLQLTPAAATFGSDCVEPDDASGWPAPAPAAEMAAITRAGSGPVATGGASTAEVPRRWLQRVSGWGHVRVRRRARPRQSRRRTA